MRSALASSFEALTIQQDYLWFCALLLWIALGATLMGTRKKAATPGSLACPVLTILCGASIAVSELAIHVLPPGGPDQEFVWRDLGLFTLQFLQAVAPIGLLLAGRPSRSRLRGWTLAVGAVLLVSVLRRQAFIPVDILAHSAAAVIGLLVVRSQGGRDPGRAVVALLAVAAFQFSTTGIFSEVFFQQRRFAELSALAVPSAVIQAGLAAWWIKRLLPRSPAFFATDADGGKRAARWLWPAIGLWLVAGFVTAWLTGRTGRTGFEESLQARVRVCVALLRPEGVEAIMQPAFQVEQVETTPQPNGRPSMIAHSAHLPVAARLTRHDLTRIQSVNPDIYWAFFMTLRGGYLVVPALPETLPAKKDVMVVQRRATRQDLSDWAGRRSYVEGPLLTDYGEVLRVCAPFTSRSGMMLGWLTFETGAAEWAKVQATARFQTFALMGVGSCLMLLIMILRQRTAEQEEARRHARNAAAADQAKTVFLAKVSHELRTPVQSILGYGELLAAHPDAPRHRQWLAAISSQGRLLIRLVNDLIDLSAIQSGAFRLSLKPANAAALVQQAAESMRGLASAKGLELVVELAPDIPVWLELDEERVHQLVINLVGNAIKFTDRGHVRVRLAAGVDAAGPARTVLHLTVADTGSGLSPEELSGLFNPFRRLDRHTAVEGAGLGLTLCRSLCEKMDGSVTVQSDGATGSVFTAILRPRRAAAPAAVPDPAPEQRLAGRRVLVAEDNPLVAELYIAALRAAGAWVERASNGLEAVSLTARGGLEVIVMDVSMPGLDGYAASRQIRAADRDGVRIVGVSAHARPEDREMAVAAGMETLLVKPVTLKDLLSAVAGYPVPTGEQNPGDLALFHRLRAQFDQELPGLRSAIQLAANTGDAVRLRERVHYLKNSADVVHVEEISLRCARVESATDTSASTQAAEIAALLAALDQLVSAPDNPFSGKSPATKPNP